MKQKTIKGFTMNKPAFIIAAASITTIGAGIFTFRHFWGQFFDSNRNTRVNPLAHWKVR